MKPHSSVRTLVLGVMISGQVTVAVAAAALVAPVKQDENLISALNWMVSSSVNVTADVRKMVIAKPSIAQSLIASMEALNLPKDVSQEILQGITEGLAQISDEGQWKLREYAQDAASATASDASTGSIGVAQSAGDSGSVTITSPAIAGANDAPAPSALGSSASSLQDIQNGAPPASTAKDTNNNGPVTGLASVSGGGAAAARDITNASVAASLSGTISTTTTLSSSSFQSTALFNTVSFNTSQSLVGAMMKPVSP